MKDFKLVVVEKYELEDLNVCFNNSLGIFGQSGLGIEKNIRTKHSVLCAPQKYLKKQRNRAFKF